MKSQPWDLCTEGREMFACLYTFRSCTIRTQIGLCTISNVFYCVLWWCRKTHPFVHNLTYKIFSIFSWPCGKQNKTEQKGTETSTEIYNKCNKLIQMHKNTPHNGTDTYKIQTNKDVVIKRFGVWCGKFPSRLSTFYSKVIFCTAF